MADTRDSAELAATMYDGGRETGSSTGTAAAGGATGRNAAEPRIEIRVQAGRIDAGAIAASLTGSGTGPGSAQGPGSVPGPGPGTGSGAASGAVGALVTFTGYCRDEGGRLRALELEHYPGMAEKQMEKFAHEAAARWPILGLAAIHRFGLIAPGEEIVLVACTSAHRGAAFEAASFLMDYMKTSAPFWKREHLVDGTTGGWVEAKDTDEAAADRWHRL